MQLTFDHIRNTKTLSIDNQKYVKDTNNPYVFVSVNSVTTIGYAIFENYKCLTDIVIPNSVTNIRYGAFYGCTSLTQIVIPESVTTIENCIFDGCTSLTMVETNNENAYIIEYCKKEYPSVEVIVNHDSYILK